MNEDLLKELHIMLGGNEAGSYEDFKNEFNNSEELRKELHTMLGGNEAGSYDDFIAEAGFKPIKPQKKSSTPTDNLQKSMDNLNTAMAGLNKNVKALKGNNTDYSWDNDGTPSSDVVTPKSTYTTTETFVEKPSNSFYELDSKVSGLEEEVESASNNIIESAINFGSALVEGISKGNVFGTLYNKGVSGREQEKVLIDAATNKKADFYKSIDPEELKPITYQELYDGEAQFSTSREEAIYKANNKLKKHTSRLQEALAYSIEDLPEPEQKIAVDLIAGKEVILVDTPSPQLERTFKLIESYTGAKAELDNVTGQYNQILADVTSVIGEAKNQKKSSEEVKKAALDYLTALKSESAVQDQDKIDDIIRLTEETMAVGGGNDQLLRSWMTGTVNKLYDTGESLIKGVKASFFQDATMKLVADEVQDVALAQAEDVLTTALQEPRSSFTGSITEEVVDKGNVRLVVKDGQVVDIRRKEDNSKIFFPTAEEIEVANSFNPEVDKTRKDYRGKSILSTTGQVLMDMVPMIGTSAISGGSTLGMMLGSTSVSYGSYYKQALESTGDMKRASLFAALTAPAIGFVESKIGNLESKLGRTLSNLEKKGIYNAVTSAADDVAREGIEAYVKGPGFLNRVNKAIEKSVEFGNDIKGDWYEEFSNFPVQSFTGFLTGVPVEPITAQELEDTFILTTLASGTMSGANIMLNNKNDINELIGYAATRKDKFEEIADQWVNAATTDKEKEIRQKDVAAKKQAVNEVEDTFKYIAENNFDDKAKDKLTKLTFDKARAIYKLANAESVKTKASLNSEIDRISKEMNSITPLSEEPEVTPEKTFVNRDVTDKKIFTDFDNTLYNPKTKELTAVGEELKAKLESGEIKPEDVEILTARSAEDAAIIKELFPTITIKSNLSPEAKATEVAKAGGNSIFIDDNKENLAATTSGEVIDAATIVPQTPKEVEVQKPVAEMKEVDIDSYVSELGIEASIGLALEDVDARMTNAEYIQESELNERADQLYSIWDTVDADRRLSDDQKENIKNKIENQIQKLEQYELATTNKVGKTTEAKAVRGPRVIGKTKRGVPSKYEVTPKRFEEKPETVITTADGKTIKGKWQALSDDSVQVIDQDGNIIPVTDGYTFRETIKDSNGNVVSAVMEDKGTGNTFTVESPDLALDIAIKAKEMALGPIEDGIFETIIAQVTTQTEPILARDSRTQKQAQQATQNTEPLVSTTTEENVAPVETLEAVEEDNNQNTLNNFEVTQASGKKVVGNYIKEGGKWKGRNTKGVMTTVTSLKIIEQLEEGLKNQNADKKNWREVFKSSDSFTKSKVLRSVAESTKSDQELNEVLDNLVKNSPEESNVAWAVANNPNSSKETFERAVANRALKKNTSEENINSLRADRFPTTQENSQSMNPEQEAESQTTASDIEETKQEQEPAPVETKSSGTGAPVAGIGEPTGKPKFSRTVERILATDSISDNVKEAVKNQAPPKTTITREELKNLSDAILSEADAITNEKEAVQAYEELVDELGQTLTDKFAKAFTTNERQFLYEVRTLKVIAQRLLDLGQTNKSAEVLNKIANIGTNSGTLLSEMATVDNDPDAIFLVNFGKKVSKLRAEVLSEPVNGVDGKTNGEAIEEINKALQEELDLTKKELARRIAENVEKIGNPKPKTSSTKDTIKALDKKADEYLKKLRDRITSPTFKSVVPGLPSPDMILAAKDFTLFAYYKFAGSLMKAKEAFMNEKALAPVHNMWDSIVSEMEGKELAEADSIIAKERILQALQDEKAKKETLRLSPAQAIARRILKLDEKSKANGRKTKSIEEKLAENELDQHTINEIRQLVEGDFLTLSPEKRAEVMSKVDDLLYAAQEKGKALRAAPWVTKAAIRKDLKEGLKSMGQTIEDLINDFTNIDQYTKSIGEEFISRTGMTAEEAAPFIKAIETEIKDYLDSIIAKKLDRTIAEGFKGDLDRINKAIETEKQTVETLSNKEKTPEEVKDLRAAKNRLKVLTSKKASTIREMERRMKSPDFKRILNAILNGGLNEDTVVNAFAARLGLDVVTPEQLRHFEALRQKIEDATIIINGKEKTLLKEREDAVKELKTFMYKIQDRSLLELIRQMFESYMYANVLSSPRTAEVAIFSGLKLLLQDIISNFMFAIPKDIGRALTERKFDALNTRIFLSSLKQIFAGDLKIFSSETALDVLLGKEGITLQQSDISEKSKDRLEATLSIIDKLKTFKKIVSESKANPAKKALLQTMLSASILHQQVSRMLVVGDYISRSAAIPYAAHQNLAAMAIESLPSKASARDVYAKISELINKKGVDEAVRQKEATSTNEDLFSYRKKIKLDFLPQEVQNSIKEYADRIAFTGRATGHSGVYLNAVNKMFEWTSGSPIEASDSGFKASTKLARSMAAAILKFAVAPFPGVIFRGAQMLKNKTPLGMIQRDITIDPETGKTTPKGIGIKFFNEHRYYGGSTSKVLEVIEANPWERSSRVAWSILPTMGLVYLFSSLFDFEDEEGNRSEDVITNLSSLIGIGNNKVVLPEDNKLLITGDYDSKAKEYYQGIGVAYEPHTIYRKNDKGNWEKIPVVGTYKDDSYGFILKALSTVYDRLLVGDIKKGEGEESSAKAQYDKLPANAVAGMMLWSAVGFVGEYGLAGAVDKLSVINALTSDNPEELNKVQFALENTAKSTVRQLTPLSALGGYIQNVKGMMLGEDKRKGKGLIDGALGNYMIYADFVEDYDFDALGYKIPYQPGPYGLLSSVDNLVASITNEQYSAFNNKVFEERVTDAHKIRTKYSDLSSRIKHLYPTDATSGSSTVVKLPSLTDTRIISEKAAKYKGEMLNNYYNLLDDLEKEDLDKTLKEINDTANQHAYVEYVLGVLENNEEAMKKLGYRSIRSLREDLTTENKSGIGIINGTSFYRKSKTPFDKKTEGIIKMLFDAELMIMSDGTVRDKEYNKIYRSTGIDRKGNSWLE